MELSQYGELFLSESREHVSTINHLLLTLESDPGSRQVVEEVFRAVHTIKGMSATMGYTSVATLSHELETLLDRVRMRARTIDAPLMELLFRSADVLESAIESAVGGGDSVDVGPVVKLLRANVDAPGTAARATRKRRSTRKRAKLDDGWTVCTADGTPSAHFEHTILITNDQPEILTWRGKTQLK